jgi:hypothetical protein
MYALIVYIDPNRRKRSSLLFINYLFLKCYIIFSLDPPIPDALFDRSTGSIYDRKVLLCCNNGIHVDPVF